MFAPAYVQPITRDGLQDIFGREISRDLIGRLHARVDRDRATIPTPREPYTYVPTEQFLVAFDLEALRDLPDCESLADAGLGKA